MYWRSTLRWLIGTRPVRQTADMLLRAVSYRRLARLDGDDPVRRQAVLLRGLVHQARRTRFGRDHDFARLRTPDDFRRLVPLTTAEDLWRRYWQPAWPQPAGSTWPDLQPLAAGPESAPPPWAAVASAALRAALRATLRTALAFLIQARPQRRLCKGALAFLPETTPGAALLAEATPLPLRPFVTCGSDGADGAASVPVTALFGPAEALLTRLRDGKSGEKWPAEVRKQLAGVVWSGAGPAAEELRAELDPGILALELVRCLGAPVALTDPRHNLPRLLTDHGVYFEFLPVDGDAAGPRLGLDGVRAGERYELVLTTSFGLWACRSGEMVGCESVNPPLVRFLGPVPPPPPAPAPATISATVNNGCIGPLIPALRGPHPRRDDGPAVRPDTFDPIPWSAPAGRE